IWAGTEIGIFESTDGGATWADANNGFPSVSAYDMLIVNDEVVVATHGRGIWSVALPELAGYEPPEATLAPRLGNINGGFAGMVYARVTLPSAYDSTHVLIDGEVYQTLGANSGPAGSNLEIVLPADELYTISLSVESFANGSTFKSPAYDVDILPLQAAQNMYVNDFNDSDDDFVSIGFTLNTPAGFDDGAVHSPHGYPNNVEFTYTLTIPIIVASSDALLSYDDVAIVEPGEAGSEFGDDDFWDYVVVEGSIDNGTTWLPLADGYDAGYDATWLATYNASGAGDATMFVNHTLNLLDTFNAGDEVVIRFRLFADAFTNAWGWAIDNLNIQNVTDANNGDALPTVYSLSQNYPNPFNPSTTIKFALPEAAQVELKVYDVLGAEVATLMNQELQAGRYDVNWDASQLASGVYIYRIKAGNFVDSKKLMLLK
ncbi:MAG: T9SS type A sorting domain-containing protein, partial [Ignavibacteria bacterium]